MEWTLNKIYIFIDVQYDVNARYDTIYTIHSYHIVYIQKKKTFDISYNE